MQQSLASLADAVLRHKADCPTTHHSLGEDEIPVQRPVCSDRDPQSEPNTSTISIAPIQAVRSMNSWITGQRPDGKQDLPTSSTTTHGAAVELDDNYVRVCVSHEFQLKAQFDESLDDQREHNSLTDKMLTDSSRLLRDTHSCAPSFTSINLPPRPY
jgi:hypothetical protein